MPTIPGLPAASALTGSETFVLVQGGATKKGNVSELIALGSSAATVERLARRREGPKVDLTRRSLINWGWSLNTATGALASASGDVRYGVTDFVPVDEGVGLAASVAIASSGIGGFAWYDKDGAFLGVSGNDFTAATTNGSAVITVSAMATGKLMPGAPVTGTGIPAGAYVLNQLTGSVGGTGTYTLSAGATATNASVALNCKGLLAGRLVKPYPGAALARMHFLDNFGANTNTRVELIIRDDDFSANLNGRASGAIGWDDLASTLPWAGKNIAILGDSIVAPTTNDSGVIASVYAFTMERGLKAEGKIFGGVQQRQMRQVLDGSHAVDGLYLHARGPTSAYVSGDFANIDLCIIDVGTNDFGIWRSDTHVYTSFGVVIRPLGALGDTAASNTFFGDMYDIVVNKLMAWNPNMRVVLATPLRRFERFAHDGTWANGDVQNTNGVWLHEYVDAMILFGKTWGIPVWDKFYNCPINKENRTTRLLDNLHPSRAGYEAYIPAGCRFINNL